jgi:hypothetical protein
MLSLLSANVVQWVVLKGLQEGLSEPQHDLLVSMGEGGPGSESPHVQMPRGGASGEHPTPTVANCFWSSELRVTIVSRTRDTMDASFTASPFLL